MKTRALAPSLVLSLLLTGCGVGFEQSRNALWSTIAPDNHKVDATPLRADYRYLRVTLVGRSLLMVLGYLDPTPFGDTEVWYSSGGEVLRLRQGQVVGTTGMPVDWEAVQGLVNLDPARLPQEATAYLRQVSLKPGYHINQREARVFAPLASPAEPRALVGIAPDRLRWFEDRPDPAVARDDRAAPATGRAVFGWLHSAQGWQWQYTEECLSQDFCLTLQRWPVPSLASDRATP